MREKLLLYSVLASFAAQGAAAQNLQQAVEDNGEIVAAQLEEITVFATRHPLPAFEYPGQVTVLGRDLLDDFNTSSLSDVFDAIPGAEFGGGPRRAGETPSIRGISGSGVLVFFDNARQSFDSGHDGRFFVDPDLIQKIEVVRGPTSALYGSGALGGVIAVRTKTAEEFLSGGETSGFKVGTGYQSANNEWRGTFTGALRSADNMYDAVANVTYRTSGDIELGNGIALPNDDDVVSSMLKGTLRPGSDLTVSASWLYYDGDALGPNNPQGNEIGGRGNLNVNRDISSNTFQGTFNYAPENSLVDVDLTTFYAGNKVVEAEVNSARVISRRVKSIGVSLNNTSRLSLAPGADVTLTYGGEFYSDDQTGRDNTSADGTRGGVPDAKSQFYGAFAQAEVALEQPLGAPGVLTLIPSVRWDKFKSKAVGDPSTNSDSLSPKIGMSYRPVEQFIVFGNWAEAFRAPSYNEIYADNVHFRIPNMRSFPPSLVTNFFIPNPSLVPEESETWEIGGGVDFDNLFIDGDRFSAKMSYYQADVTNLIDLQVRIPAGCFGAPFPPCGTGERFGNFSRYVNITNANIDGVELEATYDSRYYYARGNFSTINGRDKVTNKYVGILTPDKFFIDTGIKVPALDIRVGSRVTIAGTFSKVDDPTVDTRDAYTIADVYAVWQPSSDMLQGLRLDLGVDNITDEDYEVIAVGASQPGQNYKIALSWRWGF